MCVRYAHRRQRLIERREGERGDGPRVTRQHVERLTGLQRPHEYVVTIDRAGADNFAARVD